MTKHAMSPGNSVPVKRCFTGCHLQNLIEPRPCINDCLRDFLPLCLISWEDLVPACDNPVMQGRLSQCSSTCQLGMCPACLC